MSKMSGATVRVALPKEGGKKGKTFDMDFNDGRMGEQFIIDLVFGLRAQGYEVLASITREEEEKI